MKEEQNHFTLSEAHPSIFQIFCAPVFGVFFEAVSFPFLRLWIEQQKSATSFRQAALHIYKNDRIYAGFSTVAVGAAPAGLAYFSGKKTAEAIFGNGLLGCVMQAFTAQFLASLLLEPMMLVLQHDCATEKKQHQSRLSLIRSLVKANGIRGVYRAAVPGFFVGAILDSLGYWFYENIKKNYSGEHKEKALASVFAYMVAFSIAAIFVVPFEIIATRLRFSASTELALQEKFPEKTCVDVVKKIFKTKGFRGFWHAAPANMLRAGTVILMMPAAETMGHLTI